MAQCFEIAFAASPDAELFDGDAASFDFEVKNAFPEFRNVAFRVAVMNRIGQENPGAPERDWFRVEPQDGALVQAGAATTCKATVAVPKGEGRRTVVWTLVAFDKDLGDEPRFFSQPLSLQVKNREAPPPPVQRKKIPWWVWLIVAAGVAAAVVGIAIAIGSRNTTADDDATEEPPTQQVTPHVEAPPPAMFDMIVKVVEVGEDSSLTPIGGATVKVGVARTYSRSYSTNASGEATVPVCKTEDSRTIKEDLARLAPDDRVFSRRIERYGCLPSGWALTFRASKSGYEDSTALTVSSEEMGDQTRTVVIPMARAGVTGSLGSFDIGLVERFEDYRALHPAQPGLMVTPPAGRVIDRSKTSP